MMLIQQNQDQMPIDVQVRGGGTIFTFTLLSDAAREWVNENVRVEAEMWLGGATFACEHRYAGDLARGMQAAGLLVV